MSEWVRVEDPEHPRWELPGRGKHITDYAIRTFGRRHLEQVILRDLPPLPEAAWSVLIGTGHDPPAPAWCRDKHPHRAAAHTRMVGHAEHVGVTPAQSATRTVPEAHIAAPRGAASSCCLCAVPPTRPRCCPALITMAIAVATDTTEGDQHSAPHDH